MDNKQRLYLERIIVRALVRHLAERGFKVWRTFDGDTFEYPKDEHDVMALTFNLDEISLRVVPDGKLYQRVQELRGTGRAKCAEVRRIGHELAQREHGVWLVLGNGQDVICDYTFTEGEAGKPWVDAMESFDAEALAERYAQGTVHPSLSDRIAIEAGPVQQSDPKPILVLERDGTVRSIGATKDAFLARQRAIEVLKDAPGGVCELVEVDAMGWRKQVFLIRIAG